MEHSAEFFGSCCLHPDVLCNFVYKCSALWWGELHCQEAQVTLEMKNLGQQVGNAAAISD